MECKDCDAKTRIHPECLPIPVPKGDPFYPQVNITSGKPFCLAFTRSMPGQLTLGFREQMNQVIMSLLSEALIFEIIQINICYNLTDFICSLENNITKLLYS